MPAQTPMFNALGGNQAAPDQQSSALAPPAAQAGSGAGSPPPNPFSLFQAMHPQMDPTIAKIAFQNLGSHAQAQPQQPAAPVNPYQNLANKATGQSYK